MWIYFLWNWNGVSVFYNTTITPADDSCLYTDASGTLGYGGYFRGPYLEEGNAIAFKELSHSSCRVNMGTAVAR